MSTHRTNGTPLSRRQCRALASIDEDVLVDETNLSNKVIAVVRSSRPNCTLLIDKQGQAVELTQMGLKTSEIGEEVE